MVEWHQSSKLKNDGKATSSFLSCDSEDSMATFQMLLVITEKAMAPYSSTLAWRIPWTEEPGRL